MWHSKKMNNRHSLTIPQLPHFQKLIMKRQKNKKNHVPMFLVCQFFGITFNRSNYKRANAPIYHTHSLILTKYFVINFPIKCQLDVVRVNGPDPFFIALVYIYTKNSTRNGITNELRLPICRTKAIDVTEVSSIRMHIFPLSHHSHRCVFCVFTNTLICVDCDSVTVATIARKIHIRNSIFFFISTKHTLHWKYLAECV